MRRSSCVAAWIAVVSLVPVQAMRAEAAPQIAIVSSGSCPARDAVITALAQAIPDVVIVGDAAGPGDTEPVVVVSDHSARYRTVVRGSMRTLVDAAGNCEERARKVAIITALALEPPHDPPSGARRSPDAVAAHGAPAAPALPGSGLGVRLDSGVVREYGWMGPMMYAPRHFLLTVGGTARLVIDRGALGLVIGGALTTRSNVDGLLVQRIPLDFLLQLRRRERWIAGAVELGPSLVFQRVQRQDSPMKLEADLRISGRLELWFAQGVGAYAAITGTYIPNPAPLDRSGTSSYSMPTWWLAVGTGLVLQIR